MRTRYYSKVSASRSPRTRRELSEQEKQPLDLALAVNLERLQAIYTSCSDFIVRKFAIGGQIEAAVIYIDGLSDTSGIEKFIMTPLMNEQKVEEANLLQLAEKRISVSDKKRVSTMGDCIGAISNGLPILLRDQEAVGLACSLSKWEQRSIEEPAAESTIRGPREGFTETLRVNTSMLRRIIKSPLMKFETITLGEYTQTKVILAYIEGLASASLLQEVRTRLSRIDIDGILESGYIEEMIEDTPRSPFPQLLSTERPDVVCASLLEARVAILTEGSPYALIAPISLFTLLQSPEDYYQRFWVSTVIRWLRYFFAIMSLLLPSLYVAVLTFHQEMVPGSLLSSMATAREPVPFPALIEALMMEVTFEALREAGLRLPKQVGAAVSIVGALVVGQAAVQAGLVSAPMVIVVAITGIASFMIPRYVTGIAIRMLRFPLIILAGTLGLLGIMMGIIAIVLHMCALKSFGMPFLQTIATPKFKELKDILIRAPWWALDTRPQLYDDQPVSHRQPVKQTTGTKQEGES
ncbi:spore germination protein [Paenibacillus sp. CCS19]|uniref:spore germination protein n=1 Tax=Paenibacillus sp. CCS19 TaxID=3158387 RepID=UPI002560F255|nr:spore germination protein [Paenibacillus cellulosilyticus]GMK42415.1 spore germination protein [Paenibacillus cellulosilyticus]